MAAIEGFTEYCNEVLAAAQIGDLVLVQGFPKPVEREESDVESEGESEGSQADGDEETEDGDVNPGSNDNQGMENGVNHVQQSTNESQAQLFIEQAIDAALVESVESDVENEENDGGEIDEADDSEQEGEDADDEESVEEDEDEDDNAVMPPPSPTLYIIQSVFKNPDGNTTDITLRKLTYCLKPADATPHTFHLYGRKVTVNSAPTNSPATSDNQDQIKTNEDPTSIKSLLSLSNHSYTLQLKPSGNDIRRILFHNRCPAQCHNGWLSTQEEMHLLLPSPLRLLTVPYEPVCPVCIGKRLMRGLQTLRENYEDTYQPDIAAIVDFYFDLNPRRKALGYSFKQFDEREWGMQFDDMLSESDEDGDGDGGQWEHWEEANDPNSNPNFQGATDAAIAALPQKNFREVSGTEETRCLVCTETFAEETVVVVLPCGHFFDVACAEIWLGRSNSCPQCREKIPAVEGEVGGVDGDGKGEGESAGDEGKESKGEISSESEVGVMDGEDAIMSDVEA